MAHALLLRSMLIGLLISPAFEKLCFFGFQKNNLFLKSFESRNESEVLVLVRRTRGGFCRWQGWTVGEAVYFLLGSSNGVSEVFLQTAHIIQMEL